MAAGPNGPNRSPMKSGAELGLHAPRIAQHSPLHPPEAAAADW